MKQEGMEKLYQQMKRTLDTVNEGYRIKVGILRPEPYEDRPEVDVTQVAAWQNFGTAGQQPIDARPFLSYSAMFLERSNNVKKIIKKNRELKFAIDKETAYTLGEYAVQIVRATLRRKSLYKPLAPNTIKKKGHDKPLRDTEFLLDSIDYVVHKAPRSRRRNLAERRARTTRGPRATKR